MGRTRGAGFDDSWPLLGLAQGSGHGPEVPSGHRIEIGFTLSTARRVGRRLLRDLDKVDTLDRPLDHSETGGLDTRTFSEPTLIEYSSFDGRKIPAFVYRPSARKFPGPRPVLIDIHGGPEGQFRPAFLGRLNYLVSELGIVLDLPQRARVVGLRQDVT